MKVKRVRIKNYKSIIDSTDCYIENNLTIFAGKNESGKTAILEALEDFNVGKDISKEAKKAGIFSIIHTCGAINPEPLKELLKYVDAVTVDLKGFTEEILFLPVGIGAVIWFRHEWNTIKKKNIRKYKDSTKPKLLEW